MSNEYIFGEGLETSPLIGLLEMFILDTSRHDMSKWYIGDYEGDYNLDRKRVEQVKKQLQKGSQHKEFVNILNLAWSHTTGTNRLILSGVIQWVMAEGDVRSSRMKYCHVQPVVEMSLYMAAEDWPEKTFPKQRWPLTMRRLLRTLEEHAE